MYQNTLKLVQQLAGHEYLYFDKAIAVKITPHSFPYAIWGVCAGPDGLIYIMDADQQWNDLPDIENNREIISTIYQRIRYLHQRSNPIASPKIADRL